MAIEIEINPKLNPIDAGELNSCKTQLESLDESFSLANIDKKSFLPEDAPAMMSSFVDSMLSTIKQQRDALVSTMKDLGLGSSISSDMISGLKQGIAFLSSSVETLFSTSGNFGKMFTSIPKSMTKGFESEFADISRAASDVITRTYRSMGPQTNSAYESILKSHAPFKKGMDAIAGQFGFSDDQVSELLQGVINMVTPSFAREDFYQSAIDKSKGTIKRLSILPEYSTYKERMPEKYRNFPDVPTSVPYSVGSRRKAYAGNMSEEDYDILKNAAGKYPALENALLMAGVARRGTIDNKAGQLIMPKTPIKESEYATALGFLDRDILRPALEGAPMHRHSLLNSDDHEQIAMAGKTSRTVTEVYGALRDLEKIPIYQPLYVDKPRKYGRSIDNSVAVDSPVSVRPDYFQIMSLTLDDLKNGVILDDKAGREFAYNDRAAGKSVNRMISSSIYTNLLGMSGHNSFGSDSGPRKMLQLDLTDRLFEKNQNGDLVFENGRVKPNAETMAFVTELFSEKNSKTIQTPGGNTFSYPTINHGEHGTYVPTGIHKNGIIDLAEESAYIEKASQFIDKYGVDIFKNLVSDDEEFITVKDLNKPIDARNRLHTPAVPFSSLGGKMPAKNDTAFVDFNSITGFDGGMMVMPGYLPAKAMTVRSAGFKGSAMQVDFQKMIRDVYGDIDEFMVPAWNAPKEMKELYNKKGIEAVRNAYKSNGLKTFDEDFVDLLKYQAAIDVSMNKTPFYKNLGHSAIQDRFFDVLDMVGGMYGVETDKGFLSKTDSISRQVTQNLDLTPEEIESNNKKWNEYIQTLRTNPAKTIDMLFSNPDDPLAQRVQKDKSLFFSDPEARKRVDDAILKAMDDRRNQRLYSKGDAINALALNNPFELISAIAGKQKVKLRPKNTHLANALSLKGKGDADAVALASWADTLELGGWRYPNNLGEQFELLNSKEYIDALDKYQMSRDAMIVNMNTIKKMGGGDVDGDTIQAVRKKLAETVKRTYESRGKNIEKLNTSVKSDDDIPLTENGKARKVQASDYADILYRKAASVFDMAAVSNANDALAQGNWSDPEWARFAQQAGVDLRAMYDIDTTFAKTGILAKWSHSANQARKMGTPYVRMFKNLQGAIEEGDFSKVKDFSQVNFPSRYSNLTTSAIAAGMDNPYSDNIINQFIQMQEHLQGIKNLENSENPVDLAKAKYLRKNNEVMAQFVSNRAQFVSQKDEDEMLGYLANWETLVNTELQKTKITEPGNKDKINSWMDQLHDVQFQRGRMRHLKEFGLTEQAKLRGEGFIPFSGLAKGRVTGETSLFDQSFNAEQDAIKARMNAISGGDEALLAAQKASAEKAVTSEQIQNLLSRNFSWSQLHSIEKETAGPLNWYKKYIENEQKPTTPIQLLGTALHETQSYWAKRRMENNEDYGTPEEMVDYVNNYLKNWQDPDTRQKLFPELPTEDSPLYDEKVKTRYKEIVEAAKQFPNLLRDQKIVGTEKNGGVVHPNFGTDQNGNRLKTIGYVDVVSEDANGVRTNWDLKNGFDHDSSLIGVHKFDQPVVYAGANGAQRAGIISYKGGKLETQSIEVTPELVSSVEDRMAKISSAIIPLAGKKDILGEILNGYFDPYLLPNVVRGSVRQMPSGGPLSSEFITQAATAAGAPIPNGVNVGVQNTGELTSAFSNRNYIDEQIERYEAIQNKLRSRELGYDKTRPSRSQWDNYAYMYSPEGYMDVTTRMRNRNASPDEIALFQTSFNTGREQFEKTLRAGATGDLANFSESIAEKIYTHNTTSSAKRILNERKSIDEDFERAQAAYNLLYNKENKTPEDEKALKEAEQQLQASEEMKESYEKILSEDATKSMQMDVEKILVSSMGKNAPIDQKISLRVAAFNQQREQILTSLENLHQNDIIKEDDYNRLTEMLNSATEEDYRTELKQESLVSRSKVAMNAQALIDRLSTSKALGVPATTPLPSQQLPPQKTEEERLQEEEQARLAEQQRLEEEQRKAEEARIAQEKAEAERQAALEAEQKRAEEAKAAQEKAEADRQVSIQEAKAKAQTSYDAKAAALQASRDSQLSELTPKEAEVATNLAAAQKSLDELRALPAAEKGTLPTTFDDQLKALQQSDQEIKENAQKKLNGIKEKEKAETSPELEQANKKAEAIRDKSIAENNAKYEETIKPLKDRLTEINNYKAQEESSKQQALSMIESEETKGLNDALADIEAQRKDNDRKNIENEKQIEDNYNNALETYKERREKAYTAADLSLEEKLARIENDDYTGYDKYEKQRRIEAANRDHGKDIAYADEKYRQRIETENELKTKAYEEEKERYEKRESSLYEKERTIKSEYSSPDRTENFERQKENIRKIHDTNIKSTEEEETRIKESLQKAEKDRDKANDEANNKYNTQIKENKEIIAKEQTAAINKEINDVEKDRDAVLAKNQEQREAIEVQKAAAERKLEDAYKSQSGDRAQKIQDAEQRVADLTKQQETLATERSNILSTYEQGMAAASKERDASLAAAENIPPVQIPVPQSTNAGKIGEAITEGTRQAIQATADQVRTEIPASAETPDAQPISSAVQESVSEIGKSEIEQALTKIETPTARMQIGAQLQADQERLEVFNQMKALEQYKQPDGTFEQPFMQDMYDRLNGYYNGDWAGRKDEIAENMMFNQNRAIDIQNQQIGRMETQNDLAHQQREHAAAVRRRNRYGQPGSMLINKLRSDADQRFSLGQQIASLNLNKTAEEEKLQRYREDFNKLSPEQQKSKEGAQLAGQIKESETKIAGYKSAIQDTTNEMNKFGGASSIMSAGLSKINTGLSRVMQRLGRQIFMKAINEAKRFVQEFDKSMTSIQMITLKSDSQMSTLGDGLIAKAKELKVSIGEITKSAETLYRQGLSDEEVDERLDVITKFSKVSGTDVNAATKLITVAMNTGLVTDPSQAADIVTSLGDSAATNASEIEKGIEKAGAAAAADGTTFAELASMLTAITSTTQIGGNTAGRTLNTIIGRMNKIGTNELIYDENGNAVSGSAVAKLLKQQGIEMYDQQGNKKSTYDTLYALSQKWEGMTDAEQQQIANAIAGTRQYSNFSAIMMGMSEGKVDEYMQLSGKSEGIVDEKNEIRMHSLQASIDTVRTAWDEMVNKMVDTGQFEVLAESIANIITGLGQIVGWLSQMKLLAPVILGLIGAIKGAQFGWVGALVGAATGAAAGAYLQNVQSPSSSSSFASEKKTYAKVTEDTAKEFSKNSKQSSLDRAKVLYEKGNSKTEDEINEYRKILKSFAVDVGISDELQQSISDSSGGLKDLSSSIALLGEISTTSSDNLDKYYQDLKDREEQKEKEIKAKAIKDNLVSGTLNDELTTKTEKSARTLVLYETNENGNEEITPELQNYFRIENGEVKSTFLDVFNGEGSKRDKVINLGEMFSYYGNTTWEDGFLDYLETTYKDAGQFTEEMENALSGIRTYYRNYIDFDNDRSHYLGVSDPKDEELLNSISLYNLGVLSQAYGTWLSTQQGDLPGEAHYVADTGSIIGDIIAASTEGLLPEEVTNKIKMSGSYLDSLRGENETLDEFVVRHYGLADGFNYDSFVAQVENDYLEGAETQGLARLDQVSRGSYYNKNGERITPEQAQAEYKSRYNKMATDVINDYLSRGVDYSEIFDVNDPNFEKIQNAAPEDLTLAISNYIDAGGKIIKDAADEINQEAEKIKNDYELVPNRILGLNQFYSQPKGWEEKNEAAVSADFIISQLDNYDNITDFMNFANTNSEAYTALQSLAMNNPDFQEVFNSIVGTYDEETGTFNAPDGIAQLRRVLNRSGLYNNTGYVEQKTQANIARSALTKLNQGAYHSEAEKEKAYEAAGVNQLKKELEDAEEAVRQAQNIPADKTEVYKDNEGILRTRNVAETKQTEATEQRDKIQSQYNEAVEKTDRPVLTQEERTALQPIIGNELLDKIGRYENGDESLINRLITNYGNGINGLTNRDKLAGIKELSGYIQDNKLVGYSKESAKKYLEGFSGAPELLALLTSEEPLTSDQEELLSTLLQQFNNYKNNLEISIEVEGLKALEETGDLLAGTAASVEKLRKGGKIALDEILNIQNNAFATKQQYSQFKNGSTQAEKDEAAMSILGMDSTQFYSNYEANMELAENMADQQRKALGEQLWTQYTNANWSDRNRIQKIARNLGFGLNLRQWTDIGVPDQDWINPATGQKLGYTDLQKASYARKLIRGDASVLEGGANFDKELYNAAYESLGFYGKEYQNRLNSTDAAVRASAAEYKTLAEAEARQAEIDAEEQERLNRAKLGATSFAGALNYANVRYEQNNKAGIAANNLFAQLDGQKVDNVRKLMDVLGQGNADDWKNLLESSDDVRKVFEDLGVAIGENGKLDFSGVTASGEQLDAQFRILAESVANASEAYKKIQEVLTTGESYDRAQEYLKGEGIEEKGFEALSQVTGNQQLAQAVRNARVRYDEQLEEYNAFQRLTFAEQNQYALQHEGVVPQNPGVFDWASELTDQDKEYAKIIMQNLENGGIGLTDYDRYEKLDEILNSQDRNLRGFYKDDTIGAYKDYTQGIEGADMWLAASMALEEYGLKMEDLANLEPGDLFNKAAEAVETYYGSVENAILADKDFKDGLIELKNKAFRPYKKETDEVISRFKQLRGSTKDQLEAQKQMAANRDAFAKATYFKENYGTSKVSNKSLAEYLGWTEEQVKANPLKAKAQLDLEFEADQQAIINDVNAVIESIESEVGDIPIEDFGPHFNINGTYDIGQLEAVAAEATGEAKRVINAIIASLAGTEGSVTFGAFGNGNSVRIASSNIRSAGGGYKGGGGGGGGKSKVDALLEGQQHYVKRREHFVNMSQKAETHYERMNDYQSYINSLNDEMNAQQALYSQYEANMAEMEKMKETVKEGSEDWYKLQESIDSTREAMAGITDTIDEINGKKINITETKQGYEDKPLSHATSMLQLKAQNYMDRGQFESYAVVTRQQIANYRTDIAMNNAQMAEWEDLIKEYEEGSQNWMNVRDKIWEIKEQNAELENKVLEDTHALNEAIVSQIATDLQNAMAPVTHEQNMLSTWGGMYQRNEQFGAYRSTLAQNNDYYQLNVAMYQTAIAELQAQMATLEEGSQAWYNARDAVFEYEEAIATATSSVQENNEAIQESYITELVNSYAQAEDAIAHQINMAKTTAERYDNDNDFANYQNMIREEMNLTNESLDLSRRKLADMEELLNGGALEEGGTQWKDLNKQIFELRETINSTEGAYENLVRQLEQDQLEHIIERFNERDEVAQHNIKMIQFEETRYQNNGELTNQNTMLTRENEEQEKRADLIREQIALLKEQQEVTKPGSENYKKITSEIMKMEEQLESTNQTIDKNTESIKKNVEQIHKIQQTLEQTVDKEIKDRIRLQREMLAGTVNIQDSILAQIRKRYTDEWNLIKKDIERKKQALNEEKNLINERLNARKNAADQEEKYERLAELQRQLGLISADPTRTKEAKELRKQITDLQKELSWDIATKEAEMATQAIDDQINAYSDYTAIYEENLGEMLEDARNFKDEMDVIMNGSFEDYVNYMREHDENYKNATDETRLQMEQGWEDTWKKMKGLTDTYWEEIDVTMASKDTFLEYMKQSQQYLNGSETDRWLLENQWSEMYDNYTKSTIDNASFDHNHEVVDAIDQLKDYTYDVRIADRSYSLGMYSSSLDYMYFRDKSIDPDAVNYDPNDQYSSVTGSYASLYDSYQKQLAKNEEYKIPQIIINAGGGGGGGGSSSNTSTDQSKYYEVYDDRGFRTNYVIKASSPNEAKAKASSSLGKHYSSGGSYYSTKPTWATKIFKEGGYVDYTGPAWVDGTKQKPEAFLNSYDTESLRLMLDSFNYIRTMPLTTFDQIPLGSNEPMISIGDVNVNLYEAKLENDADYDVIAQKVGKAFTKQLSKNGFNLAAYTM